MDAHKKEIIVTIACSICVAATAVLSALFTRHPITKYQVKIAPSFENVATADYFPLRVGNNWEYVGTARNDTEQGVVVEKKVRVVMRVEGAVRGGNATLFIMKGHPSDAAWALEAGDAFQGAVDVPASTYGYLVVANKVFCVPEERLADVRQALEEEGYLKPELLSQEDLDFEFPLFRGQCFGSCNQLARSDRSYVWQVTNSTLYHHAAAEGAITEVPLYELKYLTRPDCTVVSFFPYTGAVSYSYSHHGTTAQVDVELHDYHVHCAP